MVGVEVGLHGWMGKTGEGRGELGRPGIFGIGDFVERRGNGEKETMEFMLGMWAYLGHCLGA